MGFEGANQLSGLQYLTKDYVSCTSIQDIYQYVIPLVLSIPHPYEVLLLSAMANVNVAPYKDVLLLVESESSSYDQIVLDSLSDSRVGIVPWHITNCIIPGSAHYRTLI